VIVTIRIEREGPVLIVVIDRPERRNAIDGGHAQALDDALHVLETDDDLLVGVLTGAGGNFSSGADLRARLAGERVVGERGFAGVTDRERAKPLIAAVEGAAMGGGFEMVLACDLVTAARDARFAVPEVLRSVLPAAGGTYRLGQVLPDRVATELLLTGRELAAPRAYDLGLVNRLVEPGEARDAAVELALEVCEGAPLAVRAALRIAAAARTMSGQDALALTQAEYSALKRTDDFKEGPRAFIEKRKPRWSGH
jgi:enoyl-CoA hydratase